MTQTLMDKKQTNAQSESANEATVLPSDRKPLKTRLKPYLSKVWHFLIRVIGPSLTVLALALSIYQLRKAENAEKESQKAAEAIKQETQEVNGKVTMLTATQYVDVFPNNMP